MLSEACDFAFGQPFELLQQLLPLVHRIKAFHPEHDLQLHLKNQPVAKRLVFGVNESLVLHGDRAKHESDLSAPHRLNNPHSSTNPLLVPGPLSIDEKMFPWGVPPIMSFHPRHPHVIALHQSAPWVDSLKHVTLQVFGSFHTVQSRCSRW